MKITRQQINVTPADDRAGRPYRSHASHLLLGTRGPRIRLGFLCLVLFAFTELIPDAVAKSDEPAPDVEVVEIEHTQGETPPAPTIVRLPSADRLVPFRDSWIYQTILSFRPADGLPSKVNPPRFSWPYLKEVLVKEDTSTDPPTYPITPTVFTL